LNVEPTYHFANKTAIAVVTYKGVHNPRFEGWQAAGNHYQLRHERKMLVPEGHHRGAARRHAREVLRAVHRPPRRTQGEGQIAAQQSRKQGLNQGLPQQIFHGRAGSMRSPPAEELSPMQAQQLS